MLTIGVTLLMLLILLMMMLLLLLLLIIQRCILAPLWIALHVPHLVVRHWQSAADGALVCSVRWCRGTHVLLLL